MPRTDEEQTQYNVAVKVINPDMESRIQQYLKPYRCFTDESGNLKDTCFSREQLPYVGEMIVVKTLNREAADTAYTVLSKLEGLLVLPINECSWYEDRDRSDPLKEAPVV